MDPVIVALINFGALGIFTVLWLTGWIEAKPQIQERKEREKTKDSIIERQANAIERIADKIDVKL